MGNNLYPEIFADMMELVTEHLKETSIPALTASQIALDLIEFLRHHWKGAQIYIPEVIKIDLSQRDMKIIEEFNGENWREICLKYEISRGRIYQILATTRKRKQMFFDFGDEK